MNGKIILIQHQSPDHSLMIFHLETGTSILGRSALCDFFVNDASISRWHAEITLLDGRITVRDLESSNGTFLDGKRIQQGCVKPGQSLRFGKVTFLIASQKEKEVEIGWEEETDKCEEDEQGERIKASLKY